MPVVSGTQYAQTSDLTSLGLIGAALQNVSTQVQNAALVAASSIADSYLQSRYQLPLTSWANDLVRVVCQIAAYDLMTSRGYNPTGNVDQNIRQRYLDALAWLQEVSQGKQTPASVVDSSTPAGTGSDGSLTTETDGAFQIVTAPVRGWTSRGNDSGAW